MNNIDRLKNALAKAWPKDAERIMSSDGYRLMNCWMQNEDNRERAARAMGVSSKCSMCARDGECGSDGSGWSCRNGILEWLEAVE